MPQDLAGQRIDTRAIARVPEVVAAGLARHRIRPGDIVYARRGDLRRRALVTRTESGWLCGTGCLRIRLGNTVDAAYVFYALGMPEVMEWIDRHAVGATMPNLNTTILGDCPIPVRPIAEQRVIALVLGVLDDKIESNRRVADAADDAWLTRARAAFSGGSPVQVSALISAGHLVVNDGYRAKNSELAPEGVPFIRAGNLTDDGLQLDGADRVPPEVILRAGIKVGTPWDTAFTSKGTVGRITLVDPAQASFVYSPQVCFWRSADADQLSPFVVHAWMRSNRFAAQVDAVKGQTDMADYVSLRDQRAMEFDLPTSEAQHEVARFAEPLARLAAAQRAEVLTLAALRDALLPKLVSGQIRVPVSDDCAESLGAAIEAHDRQEAQGR
jgi:type I restriction enzyme S subunit